MPAFTDGVRASSAAQIIRFKHNDAADLDKRLRAPRRQTRQ